MYYFFCTSYKFVFFKFFNAKLASKKYYFKLFVAFSSVIIMIQQKEGYPRKCMGV